MASKTPINSIFDPDFNILNVNPKYFTNPFIITAILHDSKNLVHLDSYLKDHHLDFLMNHILKDLFTNLSEYIQDITIMPQMAQLWIKKLQTSQIKYGQRKLIFFKGSTNSYRIKQGELNIGVKNKKNDFNPSCLVSVICKLLSENKTCPYLLLKEIEKYYIEDLASHNVSSINSFVPLSYEPNFIQLSNLRKHPNYSVAKFILETMGNAEKRYE